MGRPKRKPTLLNLKRKSAQVVWNLLPFVVTWCHVFASPYTKVEESFTLHAVHDVLAHGLWPEQLAKSRLRMLISQWDHVTFPGAVPRSFLPSIVLAGISYPVFKAAFFLGLLRNKLDIQIIIRLVLASVFSISFAQLSKALRFRYGSGARVWFILLSLTQFHVPYYASRTLPNFTALPGVYLALAWLIRAGATSIPAPIRRKRIRTSIGLLTFLATNTRLEIAALLLPMTLGLVMSGMTSVSDALLSGAIGGFGALDYLLWSQALPHPSLPSFTSTWQIIWPELASMHYNLVQGQSANWGIMSRHYYFTNSLPKLLMGSLPLAGLGVVILVDTRLGIGRSAVGLGQVKGISEVIGRMGLGAGVVGLVGGLSAVGHKEWRFVVYAVPIMNMVAAMTSSILWSTTPVRIRPLFRLGLIGIVALQIVASGFLTYISAINYPGGEVWKALDSLSSDKKGAEPGMSTLCKPQHRQGPELTTTVRVHFSSYPLQTGASLLTFIHDSTFPLGGTVNSSAITSTSAIWHTPVQWIYSKAEDPVLLTPHGAREAGMDYVVIESGTESEWLASGSDWEVVRSIQALKDVRRGGKYGVRVQWDTRVIILGHQDAV